ncbi:IS1595 family transposase [Sphingomonas sp.]|uniref:IS1595 family transposase n=1 Tax=Sphingomonas sp. TaxID=28214 RepID=UPI001856226B|nr:IS1595 family transposase [Sphingomonas sp.]MBA3512388.1 IS1595 family transposase [Sphingomonas sp.]
MAKTKAPTLRQFQDRFPTEAACLDHLFQVRYGTNFDCPKCGRPAKYSRVKARRSYQCNWCAHQLYPTAGTPFDRTRTSLRDWFYVMFLFCSTRNGVAAKRVEREIGVTYKTAWRMCREIRKYMASLDSDDPLGGCGSIVEIDETSIGGNATGTGGGRYAGGKHVVLRMLEKGGELITRVVPDVRRHSLVPVVQAHVLPGTNVHTDGLRSYTTLGDCGFRHDTVNHSAGQYVSPTGCTVNRLEGFWAMLKRGIYGTHIHVSAKHLPKYLGEFEYRWNMRAVPHLMLDRLMHSFSR